MLSTVARHRKLFFITWNPNPLFLRFIRLKGVLCVSPRQETLVDLTVSFRVFRNSEVFLVTLQQTEHKVLWYIKRTHQCCNHLHLFSCDSFHFEDAFHAAAFHYL